VDSRRSALPGLGRGALDLDARCDIGKMTRVQRRRTHPHDMLYLEKAQPSLAPYTLLCLCQPVSQAASQIRGWPRFPTPLLIRSSSDAVPPSPPLTSSWASRLISGPWSSSTTRSSRPVLHACGWASKSVEAWSQLWDQCTQRSDACMVMQRDNRGARMSSANASVKLTAEHMAIWR
jgi:hypothetical protein